MARFKTDCIERRMCMFFEMMGHFIGSHPWWFLIVPLVLSASLGSGFIFLQDRMSNNIEEEFTPFNGQAKRERKYIQETFPGNDLMFSYLRLSTDGNFATFIAASDSNILTVESLQDILDLDFKVRNMLVHYDNQSFKYSDVCAKVSGSCTNNDILEIIDYNATHIDKVYLTFPWYISGSSRYPLYLSLGSVTFYGGSSFVQSAKAIQLYYHLREDNKTKTDLWLESFINLVSKASSASIQVSRTHSTQSSVFNDHLFIYKISFVKLISYISRCHTPPPCQCSGNLKNLQIPSSLYSPSPIPSSSHFQSYHVGGR